MLANDPVLEAQGLRKTFGGTPRRTLFTNLELTLNRGEFIAITGESGCGKSTLLNLLAGLDSADAGSIRLAGIAIASLSESDRARLRRTHLGFVFQAFHLLPYLSVQDNVGLPLVLADLPHAERADRIARTLRDLDLEARAGATPVELSGGEMQRVAIARALVHSPALVLADEPTGNLDPEHAGAALALLRRSVDRSGAACVLVTHSPLAARIADRIYHLDTTGLHQQSPP